MLHSVQGTYIWRKEHSSLSPDKNCKTRWMYWGIKSYQWAHPHSIFFRDLKIITLQFSYHIPDFNNILCTHCPWTKYCFSVPSLVIKFLAVCCYKFCVSFVFSLHKLGKHKIIQVLLSLLPKLIKIQVFKWGKQIISQVCKICRHVKCKFQDLQDKINWH